MEGGCGVISARNGGDLALGTGANAVAGKDAQHAGTQVNTL